MLALTLVERPDHVCFRYRVEAFAGALAQRGVHLEAMALTRGWWQRVGQLRGTARADVVILQRKLLPLWQLRILRAAARRLVYDVDDALYQRDSFQPKPQESWSRLARFWATLYAADAVIVGNEHLRRRAASYVESERVHSIPTCVEPDDYAPARHHRLEGAARLVWIGTGSNVPSLACAGEHLAAAHRRLPGLGLRVICDRLPAIDGVRAVLRRWSRATEARELADADIGVAWLPDDAWSLGKCGLKVLQYMAAGLPVVANPVGVHREMVVPGRTGFLASTPGQWASAIARLAASPELRRQMGRAGRELVEQRYSVAVWGRRFAEVIAPLAMPSPARAPRRAQAEPWSIAVQQAAEPATTEANGW